MKYLYCLIFLCISSISFALDYPIVYCESDGVEITNNLGALLEAANPWPRTHSTLELLKPDGTKLTLVNPGPNGAIFDPKVSLDGKWIYYAQCDNVNVRGGNYVNPQLPISGSDIWKINIDTLETIKLTSQEVIPYFGRQRQALGVWNMGPCPIAGNKVMFTSDREVLDQHQLYVMDENGKNIEKVGYLNVASALHPERLSDGRIIWSSLESQGLRRPIQWGLWTTYPDGRDFEPFFSSFINAVSIHFHTEAANKQVIATEYYHVTNDGFGMFRAAPLEGSFEHRIDLTNYPVYEGTGGHKLFARTGEYFLTPWTINQDQASPPIDPNKPWNDLTAERVGKVTHPSVTPSQNYILCTYSKGPVNRLERPTSLPPMQAGIYLCPIGQPTSGPQDLILVVDRLDKHETQAQAVVAYKDIFGTELTEVEWLPNKGTPHLPEGTPYALIGTSSVYVRETDSYASNLGISAQGGNTFKFDNSEIAKIRISTLEWNTQDGNRGKYRTSLNTDERMKILGEIDLRRFDENGNRILDPAGNPDTSFLAKIRADEPFTFQLLNDKGESLTTAQTWHHVRPGERKYDCRGCHAHTIPENRFEIEDTYAFKNDPINLTQIKPRLIEWHRDIKPILTQHGCIDCHTNRTDGAPLINFIPTGDDSRQYRNSAANTWIALDSKHSKLIDRLTTSDLALKMPRNGDSLTFEEIKLIREWIDTGSLVDFGEAFRDDTKPTLFVHSPRPKTLPITKLVISAADAELDKTSLVVSLNGQPVNMGQDVDGIWTANIPETSNGELQVQVKDMFGNISKIIRNFELSTSIPPPPVDEIAALKAKILELETALMECKAQELINTEKIRLLESKIQAAKNALN